MEGKEGWGGGGSVIRRKAINGIPAKCHISCDAQSSLFQHLEVHRKRGAPLGSDLISYNPSVEEDMFSLHN